MGGVPIPVWQRAPNSPPVMLYNFDPNNTIYAGYTQNIQIGASNTQILPPNFGLTMDGTRQIWVIGPKGAGPLQVTPGGGAPFQLSSTQIQLASAPGTPVAEDASTPAVVHVANVVNPSATTASFTPPANSWLIAIVSLGLDGAPSLAISNTGGALTWTQVFLQSDAAGHSVAIYRALQAVSAARTVTVADSSGTSSPMQLTVRVAINANASQASAGSNSVNVLASTNIQGNIVTTKLGSLVYVVAAEGGGAATAISGTTTIDDFADGSGVDEVAGKSTATTTITGSTTFGWTVGLAANAAWGALEVIP